MKIICSYCHEDINAKCQDNMSEYVGEAVCEDCHAMGYAKNSSPCQYAPCKYIQKGQVFTCMNQFTCKDFDSTEIIK